MHSPRPEMTWKSIVLRPRCIHQRDYPVAIQQHSPSVLHSSSTLASVMTHLCTDLRRVSEWRPQVLLCGDNTIQIGLRLCNRHIRGGYHGGCYRTMLFVYSFDVLLALFVTSERIQAVSAVVPWLPHVSCILRVLTTCLLSPNCGLTLKASHLDVHYRR